MHFRKLAVFVAAATMAAVFLGGCGNSISTKTEVVTKSDHPVALTLDANITALHMTNIVPKLSGKITSAPLAVGQEIKAGEVVVQVDATPYQQSVSEAESRLAAATSAAAAAPAYSAPAASDSSGPGRAQLDVWYNMGAISRVEYNRMKSASAPAAAPAAPAAPAVDSQEIAQLQQAVQSAREMVSNAAIYSPIDGRVTAVSDNPSVAVAGNVLATIQQMTPLVATFAVPEEYIDALTTAKESGTIKVSILAASGESEVGELTFLSTVKDPATGSYMAKITFNNDKNLFVTGEFYHVRLSTPQEVSQVTVPKTAVRTKDSGDFVYIVNDQGLADARPVLTGDEEEGQVVILSGLKEGERVVVNPPDSLEIGMKVTS